MRRYHIISRGSVWVFKKEGSKRAAAILPRDAVIYIHNHFGGVDKYFSLSKEKK